MDQVAQSVVDFSRIELVKATNRQSTTVDNDVKL